jgi:hypothetical protein
MLFNSLDFIFLFLPVTVAAFAAAVRLRSSSVAVQVLLVASYVFYGYGDHLAVLLLAGSTAFNYVAGRAIAEAMRRPSPAGLFQIRRLPRDESRSADRRALAHSRDCAADRNFLLYVYADRFPRR